MPNLQPSLKSTIIEASVAGSTVAESQTSDIVETQDLQANEAKLVQEYDYLRSVVLPELLDTGFKFALIGFSPGDGEYSMTNQSNKDTLDEEKSLSITRFALLDEDDGSPGRLLMLRVIFKSYNSINEYTSLEKKSHAKNVNKQFSKLLKRRGKYSLKPDERERYDQEIVSKSDQKVQSIEAELNSLIRESLSSIELQISELVVDSQNQNLQEVSLPGSMQKLFSRRLKDADIKAGKRRFSGEKVCQDAEERYAMFWTAGRGALSPEDRKVIATSRCDRLISETEAVKNDISRAEQIVFLLEQSFC